MKVLHFAPEKVVYDFLCNKVDYVCCDIDPSQYAYASEIRKEDGMCLSFPDNTFDFVIHNQVLEHVPNDHDFIVECMRVLKPGGKIIMNFPIDNTQHSRFDDAKSPEEKLRFFKQADHTRLYGYDWQETLADPRYETKAIAEEDILTKEAIAAMQVKRVVYLEDAYAIIPKTSCRYTDDDKL